MQQSLELTLLIVWKYKKHPVSGSSADGSALLMRGQRRIARLVWIGRKATVTQITTTVQLRKSISKCTTCQNLEVDGLQQHKATSDSTSVIQEQKAEAAVGTGSPKLDSWRLEKRSLVWWISISAEASRRVRIWCQQHESMDLTCLVSRIPGWWWWCNGVGNHYFNATAYVSIVAVHVHPFIATMYPSSNDYFQHENALGHKSKVVSKWFH